MRRAVLALPLAALLGCGGGLLAPPANLSGTWSAQRVESSTTFTLVQVGVSVKGSGSYYRFINPPTGTLTVSGTYANALVSLTIRYDSGTTTHFVGVVEDPMHMAGVETYPGGTTDSLAFARH